MTLFLITSSAEVPLFSLSIAASTGLADVSGRVGGRVGGGVRGRVGGGVGGGGTVG